MSSHSLSCSREGKKVVRRLSLVVCLTFLCLASLRAAQGSLCLKLRRHPYNTELARLAARSDLLSPPLTVDPSDQKAQWLFPRNRIFGKSHF
jgi:hypothetical protein